MREYWPVLLVIFTAIGTWATLHARYVFDEWRLEAAQNTIRWLMAENRRLRAAAGNERDE